MLSVKENELLTQVGPGTPMGELMRRYWQPITATAELDDNPTKELRIMGEELVMFKDRKGHYGLVEKFCPHRRVNLAYGIPEEEGLRCPYHGWMFNTEGKCIEQPFEETMRPDSRFKEKCSITGYPVQEFAGLLWAYMGPSPAPVLPKWELFNWENTFRDIAIVTLPCSWLQCQENSLDPVHLEWLHARWGVYQQQVRARKMGEDESLVPMTPRAHQKIGFDVFKNGIVKRRVLEGTTEEDVDWTVGHPALFPNILFVGDAVKCNLQYRVPIDDDNTLYITYNVYRAAEGSPRPEQEKIPYFNVDLYHPDGTLNADLVNHQDFVAWVSQGAVTDRSLEKLGESDTGIILFRKQLKEQMAIMEDGGDPMNVYRDPLECDHIELPVERWPTMQQIDRYQDYIPAQAGEGEELVESIKETLSTWSQASVVGVGG